MYAHIETLRFISVQDGRKDDGTPAYSIKQVGQLLKMGKSKDFGTCKSLRLDGQVRTQ